MNQLKIPDMNNTPPRTLVHSEHPAMFDALVWCNLATDSEALRPFCRYIHVRHGETPESHTVLLATDGARLHTVHFTADQVTYPLEEGPYTIELRNRASLILRPVVDPDNRLPTNVMELLEFDQLNSWRIDWYRKNTEELYPSDLYRLIVALGIETHSNNREYGFNPDYLVDAIKGAHQEVWRISPTTLHLLTASGKEEPLYHAVLMGILL